MEENQIKASDLRFNAREAMSGQWLTLAAFIFVWWLIQVCINLIPIIGLLLPFIVTGPFMLGIMVNARNVSRGGRSDFNNLFFGFKDFARSLCVYLLIFAIALGVMLVVGIFFAVLTGFCYLLGQINAGFADLLMSGGSIFLGAIVIVALIYLQIRYSMVYFILADTENIGALETLKLSAKIMKGNVFSFFCLNLSFIGWALLCALSFGIGFLFLFPYMLVSISGFYDRIITAEA